MKDQDLDEIAEFERTYWWHVGRRRMIARLLRAAAPARRPLRVLDVGCGTGANLPLLAELGWAVGVEPSAVGLARCRAQGHDVVGGSAVALPFPDQAFDVVTALDVIEHLDDDHAAAREAWRVLRPGGLFMVTVPAYRFLWSVHDEQLGHRRRYVASEVHQLLNVCGFEVLRRSYAIMFTFPAITGFRIAQGLLPALARRGASYVHLPGPLNGLLVRLLDAESLALSVVDLPVGTSVVALGRRR